MKGKEGLKERTKTNQVQIIGERRCSKQVHVIKESFINAFLHDLNYIKSNFVYGVGDTVSPLSPLYPRFGDRK
jgi:hypothetical protein